MTNDNNQPQDPNAGWSIVPQRTDTTYTQPASETSRVFSYTTTTSSAVPVARLLLGPGASAVEVNRTALLLEHVAGIARKSANNADAFARAARVIQELNEPAPRSAADDNQGGLNT